MALIASRGERPLGPTELLVCVTDRTGAIRFADPAFRSRVAAERLDLPAGPAYVRWPAPDGTGVWAMALPVPVTDGALVVAFGPSTPHFDPEQGRLVSATAAAANARAAFVAEAVAAERVRPVVDAGRFAEAVRALVLMVGRMRRRLARHARLIESLPRTSAALEELAESIRLTALNAILAAHRLREGDSIGSVASLMQRRSDEIAPAIHALRTEVERASPAFGE